MRGLEELAHYPTPAARRTAECGDEDLPFKLTATTETRNTCTYCAVACGILIYSTGDHAKNARVGTKFNIDKYEVSDKTSTMVSAPFKSTQDGAEIVVITTCERAE
jgi:anaerobic selenocysteine-containing dehydrogenase